jgi:two-component system nitrate/nitrite response regulator NarP
MTTLLVADDHCFIRSGIEAILRGSRFRIVANTASGEETLSAIKTHDPEIVLARREYARHERDRRARCSPQARRPSSDHSLTAELTDRQLMAAMRAGIEASCSRTGARTSCSTRSNRFSGEKAIAPALLQPRLDLSLHPETEGPLDRLSTRERRIARLVARGV